LTLEELLKAMEKQEKRFFQDSRLASRKNNGIVAGLTENFLKDLDILPMPAYDLFPWKNMLITRTDKFLRTFYKPRLSGRMFFLL